VITTKRAFDFAIFSRITFTLRASWEATMMLIRVFFSLCFVLIMLWGAAEAYTRHTYGVFSPQHSAVLQMMPIRGP